MKKILFVLATILGLAFFAPNAAEAGGPRVYVSFGFPGVVYPAGGYYCDPAPVYYAPRPYYYRRPVRAVYYGEPRRYYRTGYRNYYRGRRYCR